MRYGQVEKGIFFQRPNRFIAEVEIKGKREIVHVKNTGRCRELLIPGASVYLEKALSPARKTQWDLIAVEKEGRLINMDSQAPNKAAEEWLLTGELAGPLETLKAECRHGASRFDFFGKKASGVPFFMEVKGVTLEEDGGVYFPDAPTERGVKHIQELCSCLEEGCEAYLLFVVQMENVRFFSPNDKMHPAFGKALREAAQAGVQILARECRVTPCSMEIAAPVEIRLSP